MKTMRAAFGVAPVMMGGLWGVVFLTGMADSLKLRRLLDWLAEPAMWSVLLVGAAVFLAENGTLHAGLKTCRTAAPFFAVSGVGWAAFAALSLVNPSDGVLLDALVWIAMTSITVGASGVLYFVRDLVGALPEYQVRGSPLVRLASAFNAAFGKAPALTAAGIAAVVVVADATGGVGLEAAIGTGSMAVHILMVPVIVASATRCLAAGTNNAGKWAETARAYAVLWAAFAVLSVWFMEWSHVSPTVGKAVGHVAFFCVFLCLAGCFRLGLRSRRRG